MAEFFDFDYEHKCSVCGFVPLKAPGSLIGFTEFETSHGRKGVLCNHCMRKAASDFLNKHLDKED